jgi:type I restriction enzyme S subunit
MEKQSNIPTLRFPEFKGEWEKKKLGEVAEINPSNKSLPNTFIYIDLESVSNGILLKESVIEKDEAPSRAQRVLKANDVLFQMVRPYQMNNLFFNKKGDYVASTGYAQIRTLQNSMYVFQYLHFQKFVDKVIERCTGTSYPAINSTDLSNINFSFPTLPEQTKIAEFFKAIDAKILALKTKKQLLQQYKKGVMQQLFSQELRFKPARPTGGDENGKEFPKWEKNKLGEVLDYEQPTNYLVSSTEYEDRFETPVVTAGKTFILGYTDETNGIFKENLPVIIFDDFTTATQFVNFPFKAKSSAMKILNAKVNTNIKFIYEAMQMVDYETGGHGRHWISVFAEMKILIPSLPEQTKIANFLSSIDEKINHTETQIQQTQTWKKGLLQKMFV